MSARKIRKAVIPAAGLGTRFLPATKAVPKELLPIVDTPTIQYIVAEAVAAGVDEVVIVSAKGKETIVDHFDVAKELEAHLAKTGKTALRDEMRAIAKMANIVSVRQQEPLGLGHAVLCAKDVVGDEPFVVMLGDDVIDASVPGTGPRRRSAKPSSPPPASAPASSPPPRPSPRSCFRSWTPPRSSTWSRRWSPPASRTSS